MKSNRPNRRNMNFESMEKRQLFASDLGADLAMAAAPAPEIDFVELAGNSDSDEPVCYLKYKLDRTFVKSWSISGDADDRSTEEVAFYYNKIAFGYAPTTDGIEAVDQAFASDDVMDKEVAGGRPAEVLAF